MKQKELGAMCELVDTLARLARTKLKVDNEEAKFRMTEFGASPEQCQLSARLMEVNDDYICEIDGLLDKMWGRA